MSAAGGGITIPIGFDGDGLDTELRAAVEHALAGVTANIDLGVDSAAFRAQLDQLSAESPTVQVGIDLDEAEFRARLEQITNETFRITVGVDLDDAAARAQLDDLTRDRTVPVGVDVDRSGIDRLGSSLAGIGKWTGIGAGVTAGIAAIGGAAGLAAGAVGGLAVGLTALAGPAAAVVGTVTLGMNGVLDAFKAMSAAEDSAAEDAKAHAQAVQSAQNQVTAAIRGVEQANRGVAEAERGVVEANQGVVDAVERVGDAEKNVVDAKKGARDAEKDLTDARKDAVHQLLEMKFATADAALSEKEASLSLREARADLTKTMVDPTKDANAREGAVLRVQRAELRLAESQQKNRDTQQKAVELNQKGVEGNDKVVAAKDRVVQANDRVVTAERGVRDAQRGVVDAQQKVVDANQRVADAQQNVIDANTRLTQANQALVDAQNKSSAAAEKAQKAFEKLAPNAQEFLTTLKGAKPELDDFGNSVQNALFAGAGPGFQGLIDNVLPTLKAGMTGIASEINAGTHGFADFLQSAQGIAGLDAALAGTQSLLRGMREGSDGFMASMSQVAVVAKPFMEDLGRAFGGIATGIGEGFKQLADSGVLAGLFDGLTQTVSALGPLLRDVIVSFGQMGATILPALAPMLKALGEALVTMAPALGQLGAVFADTLTKLLPDLAQFISALATGLAPVLPVIGALLSTIMQVLTPLIPVFADIANIVGQVLIEAFRALEPVLPPLMDAFVQITDVVGAALVEAIQSLAPALAPLAQAFADILVAVAPLIPVLADAFASVIVALAPAISQVADALAPVIAQLADQLGPVIAQIAPVLGDVAAIIGQALADALNAVAPVLPDIVRAFSDLLLAVVPILPELARMAVELLPPLVGLFVEFAPVITAVVDAFTWLAQNVLIPFVLPALQLIAGWVADVIGPIGTVVGVLWGLGKAFEIVSGAITVVRTVWQVLSLAFAASPIGFVVTAIAGLVAGLVYFFTQTETGRQLWDTFTTALGEAWDWVVGKISGGIDWVIGRWNEFTAFLGTIRDWLQAEVWDRITAGWDWVTGRIRDGIVWALQRYAEFQAGLAAVRDWLQVEVWDRIAGAWDWVGQRLAEGRDFILNNVFQPLQVGLQGLRDFFSNMVDGIRIVWEGLKAAVAGPIKFVIDVLYSAGIQALWNNVADFLKLPTRLPDAPKIPGFWTGGYVSGPGGRKGDKIPAWLSDHEYVLSADTVDRVGVDTLDRLNFGAMPFVQARDLATVRAGQDRPGFLAGGVVSGGTIGSDVELTTDIQRTMWDAVRSAFPGAILTSGTRYADVGSGFDNHMAGRALDLAGPMPEIARWIYQLNQTQPVEELIHWPLDGWQNLKKGAPLDYGAATNADHENHVHWAMAAMIDAVGKVISTSTGSGGGGGGLRKWLLDKVIDVFEKPVKALLEQVPEGPGGIGRGFATKLADSFFTFLRDKAGVGSQNILGTAQAPGGGAEQWRDLAMKALVYTGFTPPEQYIEAMLKQITSESSGNPSIIQGVQDINSGGNEAVGLLQVTPGTFAAYRDPSLPNDRTDPFANMVAALNYMRGRWQGDINGVWGHGHGYQIGGLIPGAGLGDIVPAMLEPGEVVMNRNAVRALGADRLLGWNATWPRFQAGGVVGDPGIPNLAAGLAGMLPQLPGGLGVVPVHVTNFAELGQAGTASLTPAVTAGVTAGATAVVPTVGAGVAGAVAPAVGQSVGAAVAGVVPQMGSTVADAVSGAAGKVIGDTATAAASTLTDPAGNPLAVPTTTAPDPALMKIEQKLDDQGQLLSDTAAATQRTATSQDIAFQEGFDRLQKGLDQVTARLLPDVLAPVMQDGVKQAITVVKDWLGAGFKDVVAGTDRTTKAVGGIDLNAGGGGSAPAPFGAPGSSFDALKAISDAVVSVTNTAQQTFQKVGQDIANAALAQKPSKVSNSRGVLGKDVSGGSMIDMLVRLTGAEIELVQTLQDTLDVVRDFRKDSWQGFDENGQLISDTAVMIQRTETSRELAMEEERRIQRELMKALIKYLILNVLLPIITAILGVMIQLAMTAIGAAIGSMIPVIGTAIGAMIGGIIGTALAGAAVVFTSALAVGAGAALDSFDSGGMASGMGLLPKATLQPERVLSPRQTESFERLVQMLDTGRVGSGGGSRVVNVGGVHLSGQDAPQQAADRLLELIDN